MTLASSQAINNMWDDKIRSSINENALEKCMSLGNFWQTTGVPDELEVSSGHRTGPVSQFICLTCSGSCCRPGWQGCIVTGWCQRNVTELLNFCNCKHNSDNSIKGHDQDRPMTGSAECKTQRSSCYGHCHHLALLQSNGQTEVKKRRGERRKSRCQGTGFCFVEQLMNHLMGNGIPVTSVCVRWRGCLRSGWNYTCTALSIDF